MEVAVKYRALCVPKTGVLRALKADFELTTSTSANSLKLNFRARDCCGSRSDGWFLQERLAKLHGHLTAEDLRGSSRGSFRCSARFHGESCLDSSPSGAEQEQGSEQTAGFMDTVSPSERETPIAERAAEFSGPDSTLSSGANTPDFESPAGTLKAPPAADSATGPSPSSQAEDGNSEPVRAKREVFIVDIMPICFRGRGRGKLDPKACIEWMEALIGIAQDAPIIGILDGEHGNAWRRALYPDYKTGRNLYRPFPTIGHRRNRHRVHIDPFVNMPMLGDLFRLLNIPVLKVPYSEADDVIATLAQQAVDLGHRVNVVSPDTDLRQLLCEQISIWAPRAELMPEFNFFDGRKFEERMGYPPEKWVLLRCLLGDQSDAIRGLPHYVPQFGANSAHKLIEKFTSVKELLDAAKVRTIGRPYMQEAVLTYAKVLELNETLITLRRDVEGVVLDPSWLRPRDRRTEREAYNTAKYEMRVLKRAGKTVLVRPSPDADRKLSGVPPPPKKEKPPKDRSPKWPPGFVDYKGLLQTACARVKCDLPRYELETEGLSHEPLHRATVLIGSHAFKGPYKPLKKDAEHAAARSVWEACLHAQDASDDWTPEEQARAVQLALQAKLGGDVVERDLQIH